MAIYPIRTFGDPVLRAVVAPVDVFDAALAKLVEDMVATMYDAPGVGLAAPQIGISRRVIVFDAGEGPVEVINPVLVETDDQTSVKAPGMDVPYDPTEPFEYDEGCLSVPGYYWPIVRPAFAWVTGFNASGDAVEYIGDGLLGRVLQHEVDHLNGQLLIEKLDAKLRKQALRDLRNDALGLD